MTHLKSGHQSQKTVDSHKCEEKCHICGEKIVEKTIL